MRIALGAQTLDVIVVDVELGFGVDSMGSGEGERNEVGTDDVVPDGGTPSTIIVVGLVDNVPGVQFAFVVAAKVTDVVDHDGSQGALGPVAVVEPVGKLTVPNEVVATDGLSVFVRPVDDVVTTGEVEVVARGLGGEPFHVVFGGDHTELLGVARKLQVLGVGALPDGVDGSSEVPALGFGEAVQALQASRGRSGLAATLNNSRIRRNEGAGKEAQGSSDLNERCHLREARRVEKETLKRVEVGLREGGDARRLDAQERVTGKLRLAFPISLQPRLLMLALVRVGPFFEPFIQKPHY